MLGASESIFQTDGKLRPTQICLAKLLKQTKNALSKQKMNYTSKEIEYYGKYCQFAFISYLILVPFFFFWFQ